jgi:hypothetical protein
MLCNTFFAPMHPTFREINQKKLAVIRSYNIPRLKITMGYSETVEVVHQHEYLKSVEGYARTIRSYRQVQCNNHRLTVLHPSSDPMNRELCRVDRG